jgi:hypothetical protein
VAYEISRRIRDYQFYIDGASPSVARMMESMIQITSIIHRTDYWRRGRTVEKLGLSQWSVSELMRFVQEGVVD